MIELKLINETSVGQPLANIVRARAIPGGLRALSHQTEICESQDVVA